MRITVIGAGYVGLVTSACLTEWGHDVLCIDVDTARVAGLREGKVPLFEPGLDDLITAGLASGRLRFSVDYGDVTDDVDFVFVAVGTPSTEAGEVDLAAVRSVVASVAPHIGDETVVVLKSTVPVGTTREVGEWLAAERDGAATHVASNPEFLRQSSAVRDFLEPDRVVIGVTDDHSEAQLRALYAEVIEAGVPFVATQPETAELSKYASNAFLAIKLSFINEIADLCEASGATVGDVARIMGFDARIGPSYLGAGPGFGGSCLPKDIEGLLHTSGQYGGRSTIAAAALGVNDNRKRRMAEKVERALGRPISGATIAVLGLTFKAGTDDIRHSPAMDLVTALRARGAMVRAHDPRGMDRARTLLPFEVTLADTAEEALTGADAVVIATEWPEYRNLDLAEVKRLLGRPIIVDLRNLLDPAEVTAAGLTYVSVGRGSLPTSENPS